MNRGALVQYILTLRVIQPARIQDVISRAAQLIPESGVPVATEEALRRTHEYARENRLVISVRQGSYHLSQRGMALAQGLAPVSELDNRRLFFIKQRRKQLK